MQLPFITDFFVEIVSLPQCCLSGSTGTTFDLLNGSIVAAINGLNQPVHMIGHDHEHERLDISYIVLVAQQLNDGSGYGCIDEKGLPAMRHQRDVKVMMGGEVPASS